MGARQVVAVVAVALCLAAAVGGPWITATADASSGTSAAAQAQPQQIAPDTVVMDVQVHENGTASWEVRYRTRLDDGESTSAFESYEADVENNSTAYSQQFAGRMNDTIASAERATNREMVGRNFDVRAETREFPQRYGIVVYSFQWTGFADTAGDSVRVGDALSGLFLDEKTRLLVSWPREYEVTTVRPEPDERRNGTAAWFGPTTFARDEPRVVLAPPAAGPDGLPWRPVAVGVGALAALGVGVAGGLWLYRNRDGREAGGSRSGTPEDLLSNEERVLRLLERRGGRVKQKAIVDEFDWTEAKTSQVVGSLREQGEIESFRLGRENVLALPQERQES